MANNVEDNGRMKRTEQGIIINLCENDERKDHYKSNSEIDKVNEFNVITGENVRGKEKLEAWRNLTYMANKQIIRHKLPLMPPPARAKTKLGHVRNEEDEQKKTGIDIATQTDFPPIIKKEASKIENKSDFEQASRAGFVPGTEDKSDNEEQKVHSLIEKYSQENKAKLKNFIDSSNRNKDDFLSNNKQKKHFFDFLNSSLWQVVICVSHLSQMLDNNSLVDSSKVIEPVIVKSKEDDKNSAPIDKTKEINMSQLSSHLPNVECDILEQQMQVIHGNVENIPSPQMCMAPPSIRSNDPRLLSQNKKQVLNDPQPEIIKRPRFNTPERHEASAVNSLNNAMQTNIFSTPPPPLASPWQVGPSQFGEGTRAGQQRRQQCAPSTARPQWFNVKPPTMLPPLPPPPPPPQPRFFHEPRYANQHPITTDQYHISVQQQQEFAEYQKYQQMEMQKKAWESQLHNYPNSAWSHQLKKN